MNHLALLTTLTCLPTSYSRPLTAILAHTSHYGVCTILALLQFSICQICVCFILCHYWIRKIISDCHYHDSLQIIFFCISHLFMYLCGYVGHCRKNSLRNYSVKQDTAGNTLIFFFNAVVNFEILDYSRLLLHMCFSSY